MALFGQYQVRKRLGLKEPKQTLHIEPERKCFDCYSFFCKNGTYLSLEKQPIWRCDAAEAHKQIL